MEVDEEGIKIYFDDLKPEVQKRIMEIYNINDPSDMNWDVFPLFVLPFPEEE